MVVDGSEENGEGNWQVRGFDGRRCENGLGNAGTFFVGMRRDIGKIGSGRPRNSDAKDLGLRNGLRIKRLSARVSPFCPTIFSEVIFSLIWKMGLYRKGE